MFRKRKVSDSAAISYMDCENGTPAATVEGVLQRTMTFTAADLHISEYADYLAAILEDDSDTVGNVLRDASPKHLNRLLNNKFDFEDKEISMFNKNKHLRVRRPLNVAAICGSVNVMKIFVERGVELTCKDGGQNIIHVIIRMAYFDLQSEEVFNDTYLILMSYLTTSQKRKLLLMENNAGFRPIELAAHLGTLFLFQTIMDTEGVYLSRTVRCGLCIYRWYDITEYEYRNEWCQNDMEPSGDKPNGKINELSHNNYLAMETRGNVDKPKTATTTTNSGIAQVYDAIEDRHHLSPLLSLMMLDSKHLGHKNMQRVYFEEPVSSWIDYKFQLNIPVVMVWLAFRLTHVIVYLLLDINVTLDENGSLSSGANRTSAAIITDSGSTYCSFHLTGFSIVHSRRTHLNIYLMTHSVLIILLDILDIIRRNFKTDFYSHVKVFGSELKYPVTHVRFYEIVQRGFAICIMIDSILKYANISGVLPNLIRMVTMLLAPWTMLFFIQVLPSIGYFIMAIQKMLRQLCDFCVVFTIFIVGFTHAFFVSVNSYPRLACDNTFDSIPRALFSTFMMMLNIMDPRSLSLDEPISLYILHVSYTFIVGILLINFLVAIMTTAMGEITGHQPVILLIQRLSVIYSFERRFRIICPYYYKYMSKKKFVFEGNRIYLVRASPILNSSSRQRNSQSVKITS